MTAPQARWRRWTRWRLLPTAPKPKRRARGGDQSGHEGMPARLPATSPLCWSCSPSAPRYWCLGISPVPPSLLAWAERHAGALRDDPPPLVRLSIGGARAGGGRLRSCAG